MKVNKNVIAGQTVSWVAGGKVSRLDGVKGTVVSGTVINPVVDSDGCITVKKSYKSICPQCIIGIDQIL